MDGRKNLNEINISSGTGQGLIDFLTWVAEKGLVNKNTAGAMRAAAREVLSVETADAATIDVRGLDVEEFAHRFANLRAGKFTPQSLETYQSRFRKGVEMYLRFLDNPAGWRPEVRTRSSSAQDRSKTRSEGRDTSISPPPPPPSSGMIQYPFPVRDGVIANLTLPSDLRKAEAKRLAAFLDSVAMDEPLALPSGEPKERGQ